MKKIILPIAVIIVGILMIYVGATFNKPTPSSIETLYLLYGLGTLFSLLAIANSVLFLKWIDKQN